MKNNIYIPQSTQVELASIKPCRRNTKKHPQVQIDNIAESIRQFGFVQPIVLDGNKDNEIIIGHGRYFAAKQLKMSEVPCVFVKDLTDEQIRKLRILDNKLNESEWDLDMLKLELDELDFSDFGDIDFGVDGGGWCVESEDLIQDILNDKSFHSDNLDINKTLFVISFAFPKEIEEIVKPYLIKNKDEITQRLIQEAKENASMR